MIVKRLRDSADATKKERFVKIPVKQKTDLNGITLKFCSNPEILQYTKNKINK